MIKLYTCSFGVREGRKGVIFQFSKDRIHQWKEMHLSITMSRFDLLRESTEVCCDPLDRIITISPALVTRWGDTGSHLELVEKAASTRGSDWRPWQLELGELHPSGTTSGAANPLHTQHGISAMCPQQSHPKKMGIITNSLKITNSGFLL